MTATSMNPMSDFPNLPLICLETADETTSREVVKGKKTVIDFWTSPCVRCPAALDKLNATAPQHANEDTQFLSICCDAKGVDNARQILERDDDLKWSNMKHYHVTDLQTKELFKQTLGFTQVPFYVILNAEGHITHKGNTVDIEKALSAPSVVVAEQDKENATAPSVDAAASKGKVLAVDPPQDERVFELEDLDF